MNLVEFAQRHLEGNHQMTRSIYTPIPKSVLSTFQSESEAAAAASTFWWQIFMKSEEFYETLKQVGINRTQISRLDMMIINHGQNDSTFNLLILDPLFGNRAPIRKAELGISKFAFERSWYRWKHNLKLFFQDHPLFNSYAQENKSKLDLLLKKLRLDEVYSYGEQTNFQILFAKRPNVNYTSSLVPLSPLGVSAILGKPSDSTVGAIVTDSHGRKGVTCSLHGITDAIGINKICLGKTEVQVGDALGTIISFDQISDSCFVETEISSLEQVVNASPLRGTSPRNEYASFSGIKSGLNQKAYVQAWSPDIPYYQPYSQLKVFTSAVTNPGDSGASLIDSNGNILGFSFYRTQIGAEPSFSSWIWADTVFQFHNLS